MNRDEREIPLMMHSQHLWDTLPNEIGADMGFRRNGLVYVTRTRSSSRTGRPGSTWRSPIRWARA